MVGERLELFAPFLQARKEAVKLLQWVSPHSQQVLEAPGSSAGHPQLRGAITALAWTSSQRCDPAVEGEWHRKRLLGSQQGAGAVRVPLPSW